MSAIIIGIGALIMLGGTVVPVQAVAPDMKSAAERIKLESADHAKQCDGLNGDARSTCP